MKLSKPNVVVRYCSYCKKETSHTVADNTYNKEGTGGSLVCQRCSSSRLDTIQGFDAALM